MRPVWLIEADVFGEATESLKAEIRRQGMDGYIVAGCPSLKSCWSQGKTRDEALQNIREAIELYLEPDPNQLPANDEAQ